MVDLVKNRHGLLPGGVRSGGITGALVRIGQVDERVGLAVPVTGTPVDVDRPQHLKTFVRDVVEPIKPFIEYKAAMGDAQQSGRLRSLVWPLFFDHTRREAERWTRRLEQLAGGESEYDYAEVAEFWDAIMDEHARFVAHLLDPDERELIDTARRTGNVFRSLGAGGPAGAVSALVAEPATVAGALVQHPETSAVLSAAETILDFKTKAARNVEAARIKSIIDPRLADHVRREALKFVDELRRAVRAR
ncbi:MAG TPA: DUF2935 domain-containing protein [Micromonosporaceae bacterium]|nr:DUF2935 domain-containing protein [Micromonosporaceae bacterium]